MWKIKLGIILVIWSVGSSLTKSLCKKGFQTNPLNQSKTIDFGKKVKQKFDLKVIRNVFKVTKVFSRKQSINLILHQIN